jgi:Ca2+-binding RTX toxin-like protein
MPKSASAKRLAIPSHAISKGAIMGTTIDQSTDKPIIINSTAGVWDLAGGINISVKKNHAIFVEAGFNYNQVYMDCHAENTGLKSALYVGGNGNMFKIAETGSITSTAAAVEFTGGENALINHGSVDGDKYGVLAHGTRINNVVNYGDFHGDKAGIAITGIGVNFINQGTLTGNVAYLSTDPMAAGASLINKGFVKGDSGIAVQGGNGADFVMNYSRIVGDVYLGGGNDLFAFAHGAVKGEVYGGIGDDTYIIYTGQESFTEKANEGRDWISTNISYTLLKNYENLALNEKAGAINGTGNAADNWIAGNESDNILRGMAGKDVIWSSSGNDTLIGGAGTDTFRFEFGYLRDTINDFHVSGKEYDLIDLSKYDGLSNFADLKAGNMSQQGDYVRIDLADMDSILLKNVQLEDLTAHNFLF